MFLKWNGVIDTFALLSNISKLKKKKKWDRQFLTYSLMHKLIGLLKYGIHWWIMLNLKIKYVQYTNSPLNNKQKWIIWTNEIIRLPVK